MSWFNKKHEKEPYPPRTPSPCHSPHSGTSHSPHTPTHSPHTPTSAGGGGGGWGAKALALSDKVGGKFNDVADKYGFETFWPTTGDMPREMDKCARILRSFTVDAGHSPKAVRIPPSVVASARGLAIYTCFRGGWAPAGAGGGSGVVVARLPDGSWSAPAAILPTAMAAGLQIGVDVYNAVLVLRSESALGQFGSTRFALGGELSVAAGPYGGGKGVEAVAAEKAAVYSYMRSRGAYFGLEVVGTVFVSRQDENAAMYYKPGIQASEILAGKVPVPSEAASLMAALRAAETGSAMAPHIASYGPGPPARSEASQGNPFATYTPPASSRFPGDHTPILSRSPLLSPEDAGGRYDNDYDPGSRLNSRATTPLSIGADRLSRSGTQKGKGKAPGSPARFVAPLPGAGAGAGAGGTGAYAPEPGKAGGDGPPPYSA